MLYQTLNMMGPAHRGPDIQRMVQAAAQNVMRSQRMRSLVRQGARVAATTAGGHAQPGGFVPMRGSLGQMGGARSAMLNPGISQAQLGQMMAGATTPATLPGGGIGGLFNGDGSSGGYDFPSLPDPNDPSQSPASTMPNPVNQPYVGPTNPTSTPFQPSTQPPTLPPGGGVPQQPSNQPSSLPAGGGVPGGFSSPMPPTLPAGGGVPAPSSTQPSSIPAGGAIPGVFSAPQGGGMIPLGGGMFYDPATDAVHAAPSFR